MREIKFRAWDDFDKRMGLVTDICFENDVCVNFSPDVEYEKFEWQDIVLMQYTGLKDKKGVEIYEGDLVKNANGHPHVVVYGLDDTTNPANYCGFIMRRNGVNELFEWSNWNLEVIGNIHSNPELIK